MILGIEKEIITFLQAVFAGNLVCLSYCVLRVLRRIVRHNLFWVSLEDILFWIAIGFYLFFEMYQANNGAIRWYFVLGVLIGGMLTHYIISKITKKHIDKSKKRE